MKTENMHIVKKIIYKILSLQEKFLRYKLSRTIGTKNLSKKKRHFGNGCILDLQTMAIAEKEQLEAEITNILKTYNYEPQKILEYIQKQGTDTYIIDNASNILNPIGENEGFIYPTKSLKALYLSVTIKKKISFKLDEMFIVPKGELNKYYFIYHFYNWYAYKKGIRGLDSDSQELLKRFLFQESNISNLQLADIYKLKDAIKQDKASIEFVIKLCQNYDGAKKALNKIKKSEGANL